MPNPTCSNCGNTTSFSSSIGEREKLRFCPPCYEAYRNQIHDYSPVAMFKACISCQGGLMELDRSVGNICLRCDRPHFGIYQYRCKQCGVASEPCWVT